jgi:EXLDI family protein
MRPKIFLASGPAWQNTTHLRHHGKLLPGSRVDGINATALLVVRTLKVFANLDELRTADGELAERVDSALHVAPYEVLDI